MSNRVTTFAKRQREIDQRERTREKERRRAEKKTRKPDESPDAAGGGDPDIAGIVPGPQAPIE